jgi:hypothetical protein
MAGRAAHRRFATCKAADMELVRRKRHEARSRRLLGHGTPEAASRAMLDLEDPWDKGRRPGSFVHGRDLASNHGANEFRWSHLSCPRGILRNAVIRPAMSQKFLWS